MVTVKFEDLSAAFDFVSFGAPMEHQAYVSIDTGSIYWMSELSPVDEDIPDDLETSDRYIAVPHKNDLDLGTSLVLDFAMSQMPDHYQTIEGFFQHRGAYARLKEFLARQGCLDKWYAFEAASTERALKNWCRANDIHLVENEGESA